MNWYKKSENLFEETANKMWFGIIEDKNSKALSDPDFIELLTGMIQNNSDIIKAFYDDPESSEFAKDNMKQVTANLINMGFAKIISLLKAIINEEVSARNEADKHIETIKKTIKNIYQTPKVRKQILEQNIKTEKAHLDELRHLKNKFYQIIQQSFSKSPSLKNMVKDKPEVLINTFGEVYSFVNVVMSPFPKNIETVAGYLRITDEITPLINGLYGELNNIAAEYKF